MVTFIGAGPGAADLITLRGAAALQRADIVIYAGSLVNPELLKHCPEHCRIHNSATMTLDEVMEVILQGYREDKNIVRLHTGDPSLYGAIGEQMALLRKHGIEYDVIPGVSAFQAAAAALKTEYTLPGCFFPPRWQKRSNRTCWKGDMHRTRRRQWSIGPVGRTRRSSDARFPRCRRYLKRTGPHRL